MRTFFKPASRVFVLSAFLVACSLGKPNFYQMSEQELALYNQPLASAEQVTCVELQTSASGTRSRFCGTLEEIAARLTPEVSGAQQNSSTSFDVIPESRSTNPALTPSSRPRIQQ